LVVFAPFSSLLAAMERAHTQTAPPQSSAEIDLPAFDLSITDDTTSPTSKEVAELNGTSTRSFFDGKQRLEGAAAASAASSSSSSAPSSTLSSPTSANGSSAFFRRVSPAPVIVQQVETHPPAVESPDGEEVDLFNTSLSYAEILPTVASAAFIDRCEFEIEMLQQLAASSEQQSKLFTEAITQPALMAKNRYTNVIPTRKARVILPSESSNLADSYINACLLPPLLAGCIQPCIAAQAPLPHTASDFWRMIWSEQVQIVVMLTKEQESDGRGAMMTKAHAYWPEKNSNSTNDDPVAIFGPFTVTLLSTHVEADVIIRELTVTHDNHEGELRHIHHLQYTGWPDFGVPDQHAQASFLRIFTLYRAIRAHLHETAIKAAAESKSSTAGEAAAASSSSSTSAASSSAAAAVAGVVSVPPVIVHCSAGIGRSGVWLAIDTILDHLAYHSAAKTLAKARIDIFKLIKQGREYRQGLVQTKEQVRWERRARIRTRGVWCSFFSRLFVSHLVCLHLHFHRFVHQEAGIRHR
jgi:protein tyrosine phosphatase